MEADFVDLASLGHHAVHQEIVVERASPVGERAGEAHVEDVDEVVVEIHVAVHASRELGRGEVVLDARDAAGADHLALECRMAAAVEVGRGRVVPLGVVQRLVADHAVENGVGGVFTGGDDHLSDAELHGFEGEIHVVEGPGRQRQGPCGVTDHRGLHAAHGVAGFEGVDSLLVGGDSRRGSGEYDADELQGLSVRGVGHLPAHARGLRRSACGPEKSCQKYECPLRHDRANVAKMHTFG